MKTLLTMLCAFSILISCKEKQSKTVPLDTTPKTEVVTKLKSEPQKTESVVYWQTDYDTISNTQNIKIGNLVHQLDIKSYSLNDSSITKMNGTLKEIYHNYNFNIILKRHNDTIFQSVFHKEMFKDSLSREFYDKCILLGLEYTGIRSNRLYFKGAFFVPDTDWGVQNEIAIFYKTNKKNQFSSGNYKEIE
ncbi:DUF4738 domain-containing protein [Psychroserpens sp. SPM9]|uniref:DUF4738 domain-containing protein n=1 Tax=Psychroserpens sp. SPM9 TaxID=2975598 RepID=UPI0021A25CDF|nr:DUF4738 domain-containing protein [Psychroserpens sp. SPM9]MDG5493011.1 DUF4738 domain-containing protein [Psychroserpens sp. SPM9]